MTDKLDEVFQDSVWFKCDCKTQDHVLEFQVIDLDAGRDYRNWESIQLEVSPVLNPRRSFFTRVWIALRYIFNRPPRYSFHFDSVCIKDGDDLDKLETLIRRVKAVARMRKKVAVMRRNRKV